MIKGKQNRLVIGLILIIVVLFGVIGYIFLLNPAINGFAINQQKIGAQYGAQYTVLTIAQQAAQCKAVPLTIGNETIDLVAVNCLPASCLQPQTSK